MGMPKTKREEMAFAQIQIPGLGLKPLTSWVKQIWQIPSLGLKPLTSRVKQIWQISSLGLKPLTSHVKEIWQREVREGILKEHQSLKEVWWMTVAHLKMDEAWAISHPLAMSPFHDQANA